MTQFDHRIGEEVLFVDGLVVAEGKTYCNWGGHRSTRPAVYVEPIRYSDVQAIVRDAARFPTPVNPAGSLLSVAPAFVNDGGTLICMRKLDEILGLETDARGRAVVRAQAGCRLKKLHMWLQARGREIPFQAEIGEASVGSVAVGDTKESSLDAPGYFSAHVVEITFVDASGALRVISDHADGAAFHEFKCRFGLAGVVIECLIETRPATLCRSDEEPRWQEFARRYNELAIRGLGARVSPIQTQWLRKGDVTIPRRLAEPRFTTSYFAEFLE